MVNVALVTDSVACLTKEQIEKYKIEVVPVNLLFEGKVYKNGLDLTIEQAYQFLEKNPEEFSTSAPSPGDFLKAYKKVANFSKEIICLTLPEKLSATNNSVQMAKNLILAEIPDLKIEVIDSLTIGAGQALLILAAGRSIREGKSFEEIIKLIERLREKVKVFVLLETIRYVYRTGRIPEIASKIGSILPFKPILRIFQGKIKLAGLASSKEKGKEKLLEILKENFDQSLPDYNPPTTSSHSLRERAPIGVIHAASLKEAEDFQVKILSLFPFSKTFISEFSPIMGYGTGPGVLGIAFFRK